MVTPARRQHVLAMKTFSRVELTLSVVLGLFLLLLAVRGFLVPADAARGFGIAVVDPADLFYLHVKADRDLSSAAAVFVLLALRERRALGAFVAVAMIQPVLDLALSVADPRGHALYALGVHGSAVVYGVVLAALLLRRRAAAAA
jgi:uncharacterized protein DUF4267